MKLSDIIYPPIFIILCVVVGAWFFEASFAVTLLFVFGGASAGILIHWPEEAPGGVDNPDGEFIHPKYLLMIFGSATIFVAVVIHFFPLIRSYGFY